MQLFTCLFTANLTNRTIFFQDNFILYMKLQLHLIRVNEDEDKDKDGVLLVEQLLEILSKELDQGSIPSTSASR